MRELRGKRFGEAQSNRCSILMRLENGLGTRRVGTIWSESLDVIGFADVARASRP